ncbi:MAG: dihydroneopterin aldolase [Verrucomicrobia bacterium]|nr:dihydroneopterin aldolase [Verrucomicrobiota bacterium]
MIRNVILDWSGTLVDDLDLVVRATNAVLGAYGAAPISEDEFRRDFELPLTKYYERLLPTIPLPEIDKVYHEFFARHRGSVALMPHAEAFLRLCRCSGRRLFLLSTMHAGHFEAQAGRFGIRPWFEEVYLDVADKAPRILDLLRVFRLAAPETLFIGDLVHDVEAAKAAGVVSAAVLTGFDPIEKLASAGPDLLLRDLGMLLRLWEPAQNREESIEIVDLQVTTRIGVPEAERAVPQRLWLDLSFQILPPFDQLGDEVARTVDYAAVAAAITEFANRSECRLIETFAAGITELLVRTFPLRNVRVAVKKVILPDTRFVRVRTASHGGRSE